jgi:hypothetical protein
VSGQYLKKFFVVFSIFFFVSSLFFVNSVFAGQYSPYYSPKITMQSPTQGTVYTDNNVPLKISLTAGYGKYQASGLQTSVKLDGTLIQEGSNSFDTIMKSLSNGVHTIEVYSAASYGTSSMAVQDNKVSVSFTVNTGVGPSVSFSGTTSFEVGTGALSVCVDDGNSNLIYKIDDGIDITVQHSELTKLYSLYFFNASFTNVSNGKHTLTVYATDQMGNAVHQSMTFTVGSISSQGPTETAKNPEVPFSFPSVIVVLVVIAAVVSLLTVTLFRQFKSQKRVKQRY